MYAWGMSTAAEPRKGRPYVRRMTCPICGQRPARGSAYEQHMIDHWGSERAATVPTETSVEPNHIEDIPLW